MHVLPTQLSLVTPIYCRNIFYGYNLPRISPYLLGFIYAHSARLPPQLELYAERADSRTKAHDPGILVLSG